MGFASRKRRSIEEELGEAADDSFAMVPLIRQRRQAAKRPAVRGAPKKAPMKKGPAGKAGGKKGPAKKGPGPKAVKNGQQIDKGVYNSLWCVDLAVQKYLQTCVENSLTNGESW